MKRRRRKSIRRLEGSRPAWGAWIETYLPPTIYKKSSSRPAWGAWIETGENTKNGGISKSRPAWGAWIETIVSVPADATVGVAPRMGRVD